MRPHLLLILLLLTFPACNSRQTNDSTIIRTRFFSFNHDKQDEIVNKELSSLHGYLVLNEVDTVHYRFGFHVHSLTETLPTIVYLPKGDEEYLDSSTFTPAEIVFTSRRDFDLDAFRKQNIAYFYLGSLPAKLTFPVDTNKGGMVGLYIDSLYKSEHGLPKFNIFLDNPKSISYEKAVHYLKQIQLSIPDSSTMIQSLSAY